MAMASTGNPLTNADLGELNKALFILNDLVHKIDQAEKAGRDVTAIRLRRDDLYNQATLIKSTYFPQSQ